MPENFELTAEDAEIETAEAEYKTAKAEFDAAQKRMLDAWHKLNRLRDELKK